MGISMADQYYLKALEEYPYDLGKVMENINYALSCDEEHVEALTLLGDVYAEQMENYALAEEEYVRALAIDPYNHKVAFKYSNLLLWMRAYNKAEKSIAHLAKLKGCDLAQVYWLKAMWHELQHDYEAAIQWAEQAKIESYNSDYISFLNETIGRMEEKLRLSRPYQPKVV